ncbi:MAG: aldehyde dehydrogenase family protein [Alphaproteobacteria bacterium]|nr:aldehyde dehydrogenase family protein [Alphaproteobacteria bacterium]
MTIAEIYARMDYGPAPEDAADARAWLAQHQQAGLFIGGKFVTPRSKAWFDTINPATSKNLARIAQAGASDIDAAVAAARKAQPGWAKAGGHARARYLYALARLVQKHSRLLAVLETLDNGKPIRETRDIDIPLVARHFYHHAGWAQLLESEFPAYEPVGVAGQIIPWNFPLLMLAWKIAPALAAGNTVVLKPAEFTSLSALAFAELVIEAGLPAGVVNIVTGDGRTGELIVGHKGIDKLAFTGSTEVGRKIRAATAGSGKKLTLELGGKSPFLVFDDADIDGAVEGLVDAIWFNQGQVCCAGSRLLVQESVQDTVIAKVKARMQKLRVGDPLDKAIDIGAIVAPVQLARIEKLVAAGKAEGATLWQPDWARPKEGCFYPPTLFTGVSPSSTIVQEEIFGPVLVAMSFRTPAEAVALANNTRYGLAASVWSESLSLALDIAPKLKAGVVWINSTNMFDAAAGFGGYRESGFGREGGREGLYEYLRPAWERRAKPYSAITPPSARKTRSHRTQGEGESLPPIDRTAKMYIGGKQTRPDGGHSRRVSAADGTLLGAVGEGNRKDIRDAVEAASKAEAWSKLSGHARAQILYFIAENLSARAAEFTQRIAAMTGATKAQARREVEASIRRLFTYAAWADKYDGAAHAVPIRGQALAMPEPLGVVGVVAPDEAPLLAFVSMAAPLLAMGNRVVAIPSESYPLAATDLYQVLDTSDLPGGALNIVTGARDVLAKTLAEHDGVDALWYVGSAPGSASVERASIGNLKQCWVNYGKQRDWYDAEAGEGRDYLRRATQVKNIWIPYGE